MSRPGQVVIPQTVRERCRLGEGDHFTVEDDPEQQIVTLRKVKSSGQGFEIYMQCPHPFDVPHRRKQLYRRKHELAG